MRTLAGFCPQTIRASCSLRSNMFSRGRRTRIKGRRASMAVLAVAMIALGIIFAGVHTELAQGPAPVSARLISIQQLPEDVCMWDPVEPELKATLSAPLEAGS